METYSLRGSLEFYMALLAFNREITPSLYLLFIIVPHDALAFSSAVLLMSCFTFFCSKQNTEDKEDRPIGPLKIPSWIFPFVSITFLSVLLPL